MVKKDIEQMKILKTKKIFVVFHQNSQNPPKVHDCIETINSQLFVYFFPHDPLFFDICL